MGSPQIHHAPDGQQQRPALDLRTTYPQSSSIFYRRGNAVSRSQGLAEDRAFALPPPGVPPHFSALCPHSLRNFFTQFPLVFFLRRTRPAFILSDLAFFTPPQ